MTFSFAQENNLIGDWHLLDVEVIDISQSKEVDPINSFFAYYLDETQQLQISSTHFPVMLGGLLHNYTYELSNKQIKLFYINNVIVKDNDGQHHQFESEGYTKLDYYIEGNLLVISLRNHTFTEKYTFQRQ